MIGLLLQLMATNYIDQSRRSKATIDLLLGGVLLGEARLVGAATKDQTSRTTRRTREELRIVLLELNQCLVTTIIVEKVRRACARGWGLGWVFTRAGIALFLPRPLEKLPFSEEAWISLLTVYQQSRIALMPQ